MLHGGKGTFTEPSKLDRTSIGGKSGRQGVILVEELKITKDSRG